MKTGQMEKHPERKQRQFVISLRGEMSVNGRNIVDAIVKRLNEENIRCYDNAIVAKLNSLTAAEMSQLSTFGDVVEWHNDRIKRESRP